MRALKILYADPPERLQGTKERKQVYVPVQERLGLALRKAFDSAEQILTSAFYVVSLVPVARNPEENIRHSLVPPGNLHYYEGDKMKEPVG